jgi:hypothetical protein
MTVLARVDLHAPTASSRFWPLTAVALLAGSALLQLVASLERWVTLVAGWTRTDFSIEDHRFDYSYPAQPWENLGSTAQFFGAGMILLVLGVIAVARATAQGAVTQGAAGRRTESHGAAAPGAEAQGTAGRRSGDRTTRVLVGAVAASFGLTGAHALVSGLIGFPAPLQYLPIQLLLSLVAVVGLVALAVRWLRVSPAASVACVLLLGATLPGFYLASFQIAPALVGYQSYDTTPFTETIVAASTALAALAMLAAMILASRRAPSAVSPRA